MSDEIRLEIIGLNQPGRDQFECYAYAARQALAQELESVPPNKRYSAGILAGMAIVSFLAKKLQELFPQEVEFIQKHDSAHAVLLYGMPRGKNAGMTFNSALISFIYPDLQNDRPPLPRKETYYDDSGYTAPIPLILDNGELKSGWSNNRIIFERFDQENTVSNFHQDNVARQVFYMVQPGSTRGFAFRAPGAPPKIRELVLRPNSTLLFRDFVDGDIRKPLEHAARIIEHKDGLTGPPFRSTDKDQSPFEDDITGVPRESRLAFGIQVFTSHFIVPPDANLVAIWEEKIADKYSELESAGKFAHLKPKTVVGDAVTRDDRDGRRK